MRLTSILSEAWRDTISGTSRGALWCLIVIAVLGSTLLLDVMASADILRQQQEYRDRAGDIHVVHAAGAVNATRCVALGAVEGIDGAIAVRDPATSLPSAALPQQVIPLWEFTGPADQVLTVTATGTSGLLLSEQLSETLGTTTGTVPLVGADPALVRGIFTWPDDGRIPLYSGTAFFDVPPVGHFDQCWVRIWPVTAALDPLLLSVADSGSDEPPTLGRLNDRVGEGSRTTDLLAARSTAAFRFALPAAFFALGFVAIRIRRVEIAGNLQAGAARSTLALQHLLEIIGWLIPAITLTLASIWLVTRLLVSTGDVIALVTDTALTTLACAGSILVGAAAATVTVRRGSLYRYVKDR